MKADFTKWMAGKYQNHPGAGYPVTGMWCAYYEAYQDKKRVSQAMLHPEKSGARILMIAGAMDEAWPSADSVRLLKTALQEADYAREVKTIVFPHGSHLTGLMPNREREKRLYRMIPLVGLMYRTFGKYRKDNMDYFEQAERAIIEWVKSGET